MQSKKRLHTYHNKRLRNLMLQQYVFYIGTFVLLFFFNTKAFANFNAPPGSGSYSCLLYATSLHYPTGPTGEGPVTTAENPYGPYIYDDYQTNAGGSSNGKWNCDRRFLFTEYTNQTKAFAFFIRL